MAELEFHFFHGFLGEGADWNPVIDHLRASGFKNFFCHSLCDDFDWLDISENSFASWSQQKAEELYQSRRPKILVGYSLGGRLLMHLPPDSYQKMILIGAHPGLNRAGRDQRKTNDEIWLQKLQDLPWEKWLAQWNQQEVFKNDKIRPLREPQDIGKIGSMLWRWSLGRQDSQDENLQYNAKNIFWGCGDRDEKFLALIPRMEALLPGENIFAIANAGHGVLFDNSGDLADQIIRIAIDE